MIQRIPRCQHLYDNTLWSATKFSVKGSTDGRNASLTAYGILSNRTSSRADIIVLDDIENPKNSKDADNRRRMRENLREANFILVPGGKKLYVGTPHSSETILNQIENTGCSTLKIPGMTNVEGEFPNMTGTPTWPERFGIEYIADLQQAVQNDEDGPRRPTKGHFFSQFLLIATSSDHDTFDASRLRTYDSDVSFTVHKSNVSACLVADGETREMVSVACWFDPSRSDRGDDSVVAILFTDELGRLYLHRTEAVVGDMDEQVDQIVAMLKEFRVPLISIETNGCGIFFPPKFIKMLEGTGIGVDEKYSTENKNKRIHEAFNQPLLGKLLYVSKQVQNSKFVTQLSDFNPATRRNEDDFIDAAAGTILLDEPYRLGIGGLPATAVVDTSWSRSRDKGTDIEVARFSFGRR
jgi:hypothetical protein